MFEETRAFVLYFTPLLRFKTEEDNKSSQSTFRRKRLLGEAGIVLVKQDFASNNFYVIMTHTNLLYWPLCSTHFAVIFFLWEDKAK
jgi:hypothetical protein